MSAATAWTTVTRRARRGWQELALLAALYAGYSLTRLAADDDPAAARDHAASLVATERALGLDVEAPLNHLVLSSESLRLLGSYWYATLHYVVTAAVLVWLYRRGRAASYLPARRALVLASLAALACYLVVPMAPPRFLPGYVDVLHLTAADGWWGADASAPRGLGQLTNELAAFPSLHAGWSLWVALVVTREVRSRWARGLAWAYVAGTAAVVVGTGNHWTADVVGGWAVVLAAWLLVGEVAERRLDDDPDVGRLPEAGEAAGESDAGTALNRPRRAG